MDPSWQVWADKLVRDIVSATRGREVDDYIADPEFLAAVTAAAAAARDSVNLFLVGGMTSPDEPGLAEFQQLLAELVRIGGAFASHTASREDMQAWNPLVAQALRYGLEDAPERPRFLN